MQRRKRMPGHERRRQLLEVSAGLFAERGYWDTGTNEIARAAGISEPTIYRHFSGKEELFLAASLEALEGLLSTFDEADIRSLADLRSWLAVQAAQGPALAILGRLLQEGRRPSFRSEACRLLGGLQARLEGRLGAAEAREGREAVLAAALLASAGLMTPAVV